MTSGDAMHAFIWNQSTGMIDLTPSSSTSAFGNGINNNGEVVGQSVIAGVPSSSFGFVYTRGQVYNLNEVPIDNSAGWTLLRADLISDSGVIFGEALNENRQTRYYALTPMP